MKNLLKGAAVIACAQLAFVPAASAGAKQDFIKVAENHLAAQYDISASSVKFKQISTTGAFARVYLKVHVSETDKKTVFCKVRKKTKAVEFCKEKG